MKKNFNSLFLYSGTLLCLAVLTGAPVQSQSIVDEPNESFAAPENVLFFEYPERFIVGTGVITPLEDDDSLAIAVNSANAKTQEAGEETDTDRPREGQQVVDGSQFSVVAPIYLGSSGDNVSFLRFANMGSTAARVFFDVVGSVSGNQYGPSTLQFTLQPNATRQFNVEDNMLALFDPLASGDTTRSIYLREHDSTNQIRYQHIVFNVASRFFENVSLCRAETKGSYENANQRLMNVHTTSIPDYPSTITVHNYSDNSETYFIIAYNAGGVTKAQVSFLTSANTTRMFPFSEVQAAAGWTPTSSELHATVVVSNPGVVTNQGNSSNFEAVIGHTVFNTEPDSLINMTDTCGIRIP